MFAGSIFVAAGYYLGPVVGGVAGLLIMAVVTPVFVGYGHTELATSAQEFRAGRTRIEWSYLSAATPLSAAEFERRRGRDADGRAWLLLRPYLSRAVEITLDDPDDPAPYWLIATRHPRRLSEALAGHISASASSRAPGPGAG